MSQDPLDSVLDKLTSGDEAAAAQVFQMYEPILRMVVRRMLPSRLRAKFDSVDVVQSVWADLLTGFREAGWKFNNPAQLRSFLIKITRNRFLDRVREINRKEDPTVPLDETRLGDDSPDGSARPSEVAQANEVWSKLLLMCPPAHRELLELRRQGYSMAEIAERTGLHESSVRRVLYELARKYYAMQRSGSEG